MQLLETNCRAATIATGPESLPEEIANSITHGVGCVLSIIAGVALVAEAVRRGDAWLIVGCGIYALTTIAVYAASTLSHAVQTPRLKRWFRMLDQGCIYLMIVGSFTPVALAYLSGWLWVLFALMWGVALLGFFSKVVLAHRIEGVAIWGYVLLGWMLLTFYQPVVQYIPSEGLWWILVGGACYTIGTIFLILDSKVPYFHALWHLLVIAGTACHYRVVLCDVVWQVS
jgi:hemolysin III